MTPGGTSPRAIECALLWKLSRLHGWTDSVSVSQLARDANVQNEKRARAVARNRLSKRNFIGYHQALDTIWLRGPPQNEVFYFLRDECGHSNLQIEATFSSYFDGF